MMSIIALGSLLFMGLALLGALAGVVLLVRRRARAAGTIVLGIGLTGIGLLLVWVLLRLHSDFGGWPAVERLPGHGVSGAPTNLRSMPGMPSSARSTMGPASRSTRARRNTSNSPAERTSQIAMSERAMQNCMEKPQVARPPAAGPAQQSVESEILNTGESEEHPAGRSAEESFKEAAEKSDMKPAVKVTAERIPSPEPRPAWVDAAPRRSGDAYQVSVVIGPYATRLECDAKLPEALQAAVDAYAGIYLGPEAVGPVRLPAEELRTQLVKGEWEETIQASFGPMKQLHVLLQFDHKIRDRIKEEQNKAAVARRLAYTATGFVGGWLLLAVLFSFLKLNAARGGGAHRLRLGLAALLAAAAVVVGAWLVIGVIGGSVS